MRQADKILLLADGTQPAERSLLEEQFLRNDQPLGATQVLVLIHPANTNAPQRTANWLRTRPAVSTHYHIRRNTPTDMARLARILSGMAIGLVLAGGGAKGFTHIGVMRALGEAGVPIDFVGGTSMGALIAAAVSFGQPASAVTQHPKKGALSKPTNDYNLLPFISLIRGRRMEQMFRNTVNEFLGRTNADLEDSWLTLLVISSNHSKACETVHTRGDLLTYLWVSSAIPGVLPPVIVGDDLLVDGGTFNNFPADVMSRQGVGKVIGVDLVIDKPRKMTLTVIPHPNALLRDRFRPRHLKKYRLPSLASIMVNSMLLYSAARRNETKRFIDLYFNPDVSWHGLMDWASYDTIVQKGYEHGQVVLADLSADELTAFQG